MSASDVVHLRTILQQDLKAQWLQSYLDSWLEDQHTIVKSQVDRAKAIMEVAALAAENFFVNTDMCRLAALASPKLPDDEVLYNHDLYSPSGFMVFEEPFILIDVRGLPLAVDAVLWHSAGPRVLIYTLVNRNNMKDGTNLRLLKMAEEAGKDLRGLAMLTPNSVTQLTFNEALPKSVRWSEQLEPEESHNMKVDFRETEQGYVMSYPKGIDLKGGPITGIDPFAKYLLTIWRLMQQTLASLDHEQPDRAIKRQALRKNVPTGVLVIRLRRRDKHRETGMGTPLSYRQIVTGHWKNQWYPSLGVHKRILINPYVRGPEDAPFSTTEKVRALVR